jgi:Zn-dependent M28 family amino/carboxypeptidase
MNETTEKLWEDETRNRRMLLNSMLIGVLIMIIFGFLLCFWITQPLLFSSKIENPEKVDIKSLQTHVEKLSNEFYPRNYLNNTNLNKSADYIRTEFEKTKGIISEQNYRVNENTYRNISVIFGKESKDRIVVGAHYDSAYQTHGADDNASGVAGLIELAKLLDKTDLPMQVELVAYTLEEPPFFATEKMGSYIHAKSLKENDVNVRLMISLEMIGYFSDEPNSQQFPVSFLKLIYPSEGNFISIVGNFSNVFTVRNFKSAMQSSNDLPVYSSNVPSFINGVDFSDHRNYWNLGFDAIMITDTAFYRNFNYHSTEDTAEKLDYVRMAKVVEGVYQAGIKSTK